MAKNAQFSLLSFLKTLLRHWVWFVISLFLFTGLGALYVLTREPVYERSEQILINKQDSGGGVGDIADSFASLGLVANNTDVNNELIAITSPAVLWEVVRKLHLDMNYTHKGTMHKVTLYGSSLPVEVRLDSADAETEARMRMTLDPSGSIRLDRFELFTAEGKKKFDYEVRLPSVPATVSTPAGPVTLLPNGTYKGQGISEPLEIKVRRNAIQNTVEDYSKRMTGDLVDQDADVIELTVKDVCIERAIDILRQTLAVYNQNWIDDKNRMAVATSAFIDERLRVIEAELGHVDNQIADYQSATGTANLQVSSELSLIRQNELEGRILETENEMQMSRFVRDYLKEPGNAGKVVPMNTGMGSQAIEVEMGKYNEMLLARDNLAANSSASNPLVQTYDSRLAGLRSAMVRSLDTHIEGLAKSLRNLETERSRTVGNINRLPVKALPLLTDERQQKVKESLYLFLLQKREENELSQKFTADNVRVITPPMGSLKPVKPRKVLILSVAFVIGLLVPLTWIYLSVTSDTKVRSRKDLEDLPLPFAGEIPQIGKRKKTDNRRKKEESPLEVVAEGNRDVVNEAFRVVRSNLSFMSTGSDKPQTVMLTSVNPASGKSFVALNLALSFAIKKNRVLLIDCDLRHGSTSMTVGSPHKGLSQWLAHRGDSWQSLVCKTEHPGLQILPIGSIPPNPAELLENGALSLLLEEARKDYDWIFLDCPPVNIVVDTQAVAPHVDSTIFVVRAGLLEKEALEEIIELYTSRRLPRMSVLLNGTDAVNSRYHAYGPYGN